MFTRILTSSLLFLVAIGGFFVNTQSYANTTGQPGAAGSQVTAAASQTESKWLNDGIQAFNAILGILTVILSPAIIFAGWLMSPDWTSGDLFGLREPMHKMWIIVSNIVYFIYAILLIIIALATIFGKENFSYKSMIPKLALGILMVPFTWWFVQWTISLATVVTASVVNIPMETLIAQYPASNNEYLNTKIIPKTYTITSLSEGKTETSKTDCSIDKTQCLGIQDILESDGGIYNTLLIYAYNVFKIQDYKNIDSVIGKVSTAGQLLNNVVISAIMLLIFGLLVMALIAMLLLRAIKLWMYAIFSPIFTLHFVAGKELFGKSTEGFDLKEFIGLCFVPAVVGLTLSFGLMIVSIVQIPSKDTTSANNTCDQAKMDTLVPKDGGYDGGCVMARLMGTTTNTIRRGVIGGTNGSSTGVITDVVSIAGMNIVFKGLATNISQSVASANAVSGAFSTAGGIFGTIIIDIIALIFIWMAFMAGKGVSKAVEAAVKPFEDMGNQVGSFAASLPKYAPLPIPGGSPEGAKKIISMGQSAMDYRQNKKLEESGLYKALKEQAGQGAVTADRLAASKTVLEKGIYADARKEALSYKSSESEAFIDKVVKTTSTSAQDNIIGSLTSAERTMAKDLMEKLRKGEITPEGKLQLHALIAGELASNITGKNIDVLKTIIDGKAKSSTTTTPGNNQSSGASLLEKAGDKSINININGKTESTINIDNPKISALTETAKKFITENITEDDFRAGLNGKGLTKEQQDKIIAEFKPILKSKT